MPEGTPRFRFFRVSKNGVFGQCGGFRQRGRANFGRRFQQKRRLYRRRTIPARERHNPARNRCRLGDVPGAMGKPPQQAMRFHIRRVAAARAPTGVERACRTVALVQRNRQQPPEVWGRRVLAQAAMNPRAGLRRLALFEKKLNQQILGGVQGRILSQSLPQQRFGGRRFPRRC